jgi:hypothetical protein
MALFLTLLYYFVSNALLNMFQVTLLQRNVFISILQKSWAIVSKGMVQQHLKYQNQCHALPTPILKMLINTQNQHSRRGTEDPCL